ncbi:hypothetical protein B0H11DRAFT_1909298 [Mycena galericulata]|nr:hypothetical protein B0H11DRAFT_1909298 [Mycena galericulata]
MTKRKGKPHIHEAQDLAGAGFDAEAVRKKRRERAAEYRKHVFLTASGRRAAVKERRRQWDPPKKLKPAPSEKSEPTSAAPPTESEAPDNANVVINHADTNTAVVSLTSAERFALGVLAEMAESRLVAEDGAAEQVTALRIKYSEDLHPPPPAAPPAAPLAAGPSADNTSMPYARSDGVDSILEMAMQLSSHSSISRSHHSSAAAVLEAPVRDPNRLQLQQIWVGELADSVSEGELATWLNENPDTAPTPFCLTAQRIISIWKWREHEHYDSDWDWEARRGFAEATLRQRALYA